MNHWKTLLDLSVIVPLVGSILGIGCASSGVNRGDVNLVSLEEEWQLGQRLESDLARELDLVRDPGITNYVSRLGQKIVDTTEMARYPWKFHVVRSPDVNAFNIPGGHVYVNTGLIVTTDSASELAGVMAHEISHGVARHATEQLTRAYGLNILAGLALGENPETYERILAQIVGTGTMAQFSQSDEREADSLGVHYMARAGYHPEGMASVFLELLQQRQRRPSSVEQFFSSHPLTEERVRGVRSEMGRVGDLSQLIRDEPGFRRLRGRIGG